MIVVEYALLSAPLFAMVLLGYLLACWSGWQQRWTTWLSRLVIGVILPGLLFHTMSDLRSLPPVNARLLIAFFGGCFIVFILGRLVASRVFKLDGVAQSVFAMGGIFSNNVLLGLPMAKAALGIESVPSVALVVVFNALTLWTLVSVSIEWARHGSFTPRGLAKMMIGVITTPLVAGILFGTLFSLSGLPMPAPAERALEIISAVAGPSALLVLGMGLAHYNVRAAWRQSMAITAFKLVALPLIVWGIAILLRLPPIESRAVVLLASMSIGANVYVMSTQFDTMQGPIASSMVISTMLAALTTPLLLAATAAFY
jgi:malonate transporter and related proteins